MKILQSGVPKCGNFWLYQLLHQALKKAGRDAGSFIEKQPIYQLAQDWDLNYPGQAAIDVLDITDLQCSYRISSIYRRPIESLPEYVGRTNHVWTHSPICKKSQEVFELFDKKIYIIRDPRDRAISAANYYTSPYMLKYFPQEETNPRRFLEKNFDQLMHEWTWHVFDHLRLSEQWNIHILFSENLLADFQTELSQLLNYLDLPLSQSDREEIEAAVSFGTLKKKNPKHLKKGTSGHWREQLSTEQKEKANKATGSLLEFLGYGEGATGNPAVPINKEPIIYEALKQRLLKGLT